MIHDIRMYLWVYVCTYVCMDARHVCMHVNMYVCMYVYMYACMYVCTYVCIGKYAFIHIYDPGMIHAMDVHSNIAKTNAKYILRIIPNAQASYLRIH